MQTDEAVEQQQHLTFLLADEEYAIQIIKVKEIVEYETVTRIPQTPKWVRGVINLRGEVVPVADLAVKFGLEERPVTKTTCIVMVEGDFGERTSTMGLVVDAVSQVIDISQQDIRPVPEVGARLDHLLGMVSVGERLAMVLDVEKVLSTDEVLRLDEVAAMASENAPGEQSAEPRAEAQDEPAPEETAN